MKKLIFVAACLMMAGCNGSRESEPVKGVVLDATMNTLIIVTGGSDTLSFSTADADKSSLDGLLIGDTVEVRYSGKYEPGIAAESVSGVTEEE